MCYSSLALFVLAAGSLTIFATPLASRWAGDMRVKHAWDAVPENWESLGPPKAGATIDLRIALKHHRGNALIDALYEVSTPNHPRYGAHLSREQIAKLVAPHPKTLELVNSWLEYHGVPSSSISMTHGGSWLTATGVPVSQANGLLGASYQLYRHAWANDTILRTIGYALPAALQAHVQTVAPTTYFGPPRTPPRMRRDGAEASSAEEPVTVLSSRDDYVTPSYLRWLYKTVNYVPSATDRNVLGVTGYLEQYPSPADLKLFLEEYRADATDATYNVVQINGGGNDPSNPGFEANLNIQYTQAMAYPTPHIFYSTGGRPPFTPDNGHPTNYNEPYLDWLNYLLSHPNIPQTISTSYVESEQTVPLDYAISVCDLFAQLGTRGASVLFSSGNNGVGLGDCMVNDGSEKVQFLPTFPSSCPWITSVGGTTSDRPELAASFSSGGFSNYFELPSYQHNAVSTFLLNLGRQYEGLYNASSRGFPDIAAQARRFAIDLNGEVRLIAGTSCAAPVVAGIISLLNDFLLSRDRPPLGFLNPWLYDSGLGGLNDIMFGSNPGCNTVGFSAVVGWDPVTGLGTPDFYNLKEILAHATSSTSVSATSTSAAHPTSPTSVAPPNTTLSTPRPRGT